MSSWKACVGPNAPAWEIRDADNRLVASMACLETNRADEAEHRAELVALAPEMRDEISRLRLRASALEEGLRRCMDSFEVDPPRDDSVVELVASALLSEEETT